MDPSHTPTSRATRELLVDAAAKVMRERGLARCTTKEVARAAGYSEATLYKHFTGKEELFLCVLRERLPALDEAMQGLDDLVGTGTVREHLERLAGLAIRFYARSTPIGASLFSEPRLLASHQEALRQLGSGPQKPTETLSAYLRAEQRAGRIHADAEPEAAATLLLGGCFQHSFLAAFLGEDVTEEAAAGLARRLVTEVLRGIAPAAHDGTATDVGGSGRLH